MTWVAVCVLCAARGRQTRLETDDRFGVLGGTTPAQRKAMRGNR